MWGPYPSARRVDAQRTADDPSLERYLQKEFRGGTTLQELLEGRSGPRAAAPDRGVHVAVVRFVRLVLLNLRRVKPVPAPMG